MSKPFFKERIGWLPEYGHGAIFNKEKSEFGTVRKFRVRVTDAREPTAAQAVRRVLQAYRDAQHLHPDAETRSYVTTYELSKLGEAAGFNVSLKSGRVSVRKIKVRK